MTIAEAFLKSKTDGVKITHRFFSKDEYITVKGNRVETEEGYTLSTAEFINYRTGVAWETDWEIYKEPSSEALNTNTHG